MYVVVFLPVDPSCLDAQALELQRSQVKPELAHQEILVYTLDSLHLLFIRQHYVASATEIH